MDSQVLQISPAHEITFKGPFDHVVTSYVELFNPTEFQVYFKIKTTAPRRYCVRPNSGLIKASEKIKIAIMLQPIENDSQSERSRHKFMVQSIIVQEPIPNVDTIWNKTEDIMVTKLRCVFQMPTVSEDSELSVANSTTPISTNEQQQQQSPSKPPPSYQDASVSKNLSDISTQSNDERQVRTLGLLPRDENILLAMMLLIGMVGILLGKYII